MSSILFNDLCVCFFLLVFLFFFAGQVFKFKMADVELFEAHGNHYKVS